jgi:hypothetical protein
VKFQSSFASIVKVLTLQAIVGSRNVQFSYGKMLDLHDLLFHDFTHMVPFFFLDQKIMIKNHNPFPLTYLDLKLIIQILWCYIHIFLLLELFDIGL